MHQIAALSTIGDEKLCANDNQFVVGLQKKRGKNIFYFFEMLIGKQLIMSNRDPRYKRR
jgi:hypothetical protein